MKTLQVIAFLISTVIIIPGMISCVHESNEIAMLDEVCFEADILPIFQTSCAISGCHDNSGGESEYIFNSFEGIQQAVVPGNPKASPAYKSLVNKWSGEDMMPPNQPLSEENRTLIRVWISQGARRTSCVPIDSATYSNPKACFQRDIIPVLLSSCAISGCHDAITAEEEFKFIDYPNVLRAVSAYNPTNSKLYEVITRTDLEDRMPPPPYNALPEQQIDSIYSWIKNGAMNEFCGEPCDTVSEISFASHIWPIINTNCKGCHSGASPSGGINLLNYADVNSVASVGKLVGAVQRKSPFFPMPPSGSLSLCKVRQIEMWVQNGFLNN